MRKPIKFFFEDINTLPVTQDATAISVPHHKGMRK